MLDAMTDSGRSLSDIGLRRQAILNIAAQIEASEGRMPGISVKSRHTMCSWALFWIRFSDKTDYGATFRDAVVKWRTNLLNVDDLARLEKQLQRMHKSNAKD